MAYTYKILGQIFPTANTLTNVYVTPASTSAIVTSVYLTNGSQSNANVSLVVVPVDETLDTQHYIFKDMNLQQADTLVVNLNLTLEENVILAANNAQRAGTSSTANVSISAFGVEIT